MPAIPLPRAASAPSQLNLRSVVESLSSLIPRHASPAITEAPPNGVRDVSSTPLLAARQNNNDRLPNVGIIPTHYQANGPAPGTVIGIVLGSVAGFLLIVWLLWSLTNSGGGANIAGEEEVVVRRRPHSPHSRRSRRSSRPEVREVSRSPRRSAVIVEERRERPRSRSVVIERRDRRVPGDDVVEVEIEEDEYHVRRNSGRRSGGYARY